jgi:hypothetical protein
MKRGEHATFGATRSYHVTAVEPIYRGGKRRTDRYWKWYIIDETTGAVTHLGSAPTKTQALAAMAAAS